MGSWDTVWTAIGAVSTGGALLLTAATFRQGASRERRAQAARISAISKNASGTGGNAWVHVDIENKSDQPIYDVFAIAEGALAQLGSGHGDPLGGGDSRRVNLPIPVPTVVPRAGVQFTDNFGRSWTRFPDGQLYDRTRLVRHLAKIQRREDPQRPGIVRWWARRQRTSLARRTRKHQR